MSSSLQSVPPEAVAPADDGRQAYASVPFVRRVLIVGAITLAFVAAALLFRAIIDVLLIIFAAILLALLIRAPADWLAERTPLGPKQAVVVVVLGGLLLLGLGGWWLAPAVVEQTGSLSTTIPESLAALQQRLAESSAGAWLLLQLETPEELVDQQGMLRNVTGLFSTSIGVLTGLIVWLFLALYMALEPRLYRSGLLTLVVPSRRPRIGAVLDKVGHTLRWWLVSKLVAMAAISLLTTLGLWALGIPLALALGIIAGLLSFIPNLGPTLALVPAVLIALTEGPPAVAKVVALYLAVQAIESYGLTPYIERKTVALPPALTMAGQVALAVLVGSLGIFLAAPLLAAGIVVVRMLYVEDLLGDRAPAVP